MTSELSRLAGSRVGVLSFGSLHELQAWLSIRPTTPSRLWMQEPFT
jgi:hypothetical protein